MKSLSWIPLVALNTYVIGHNMGLGKQITYKFDHMKEESSTSLFDLGPLPWALNGEMFSEEAKSMSSALSTATNWTTTFLV